MSTGACTTASNTCDGKVLLVLLLHLHYASLRIQHEARQCAAKCEAQNECVAFDRPNVFGKGECCLYPAGQAVVPDGSPQKRCFVWIGPRALEAKEGRSSYFGEIWRQPALQNMAHLSTDADKQAASAIMDLCLPWSHCSFRIFNCRGQPLYALVAKMLASADSPLQLVWSYEIRNSSGHYLGRTSELQSGYRPIELYDAQGRNVATLSTVWTFLSSVSTGTWYINNEFPGIAASEQPLLDGRLVAFLAAHQFAAQGWFGPFWTLLFWCSLLGGLAFVIKRWLQAPEKYGLIEEETSGCWNVRKREVEVESKNRVCRAC